MLDPDISPERIRYLCRLVKDIKQYEIFLGHDIDDAEYGKQRVPFYEQIAQIGDRLGHRIFVPYRHVKFPGDHDEMNPPDTNDLLAEVMIPQVKLLLIYLGKNSTSVGHFIGKAMHLGKEMIYFYEKGTRLETVEEVEGMILAGIMPEQRDEVRRQPRVMFHRNMSGKLYKYPHIKEIIEFGSDEECISRLEATIRKHLIT